VGIKSRLEPWFAMVLPGEISREEAKLSHAFAGMADEGVALKVHPALHYMISQARLLVRIRMPIAMSNIPLTM